MKKINKTLIGLILIITMLVSAVACGKNDAANNGEETLQIYVWRGGYGTDWCDAIIEEFKKQDWVKEKYPNLKILTPTYNDNRSFTTQRLNAGTRNTYDLLFHGSILNQYYGETGEILDLTDVVYNTTVPNESILFKDKMNQSYLTSIAYTDVKNPTSKKYYCIPWASGMGAIIYNEDILNSFGLKVPNTTDELLSVCQTIMDNKNKNNGLYNRGYSFIQARDATAYFEYLLPIWWTQYEGMSRYIDFWNGIDNGRYSLNIFQQQGRKYALEVMEKILNYKTGYLSPDSFNLEFMASQLSFFNGNAVFHVNGDWLENEMKDLISGIKDMATFKTMKTPIISELGVKLGITDKELSALVDYVDGVGTKPQFVSTEGYSESEVIEAVTAARGVVQSIGPYHHAVIPKYATGKEVAIDFLRFMATDIASEAYLKATNGNTLPFNYDVKTKNPTLYNSFSTIQQSRIDYFTNGLYPINTMPTEHGFALYQYGGLKVFASTDIYTQLSASSNTKTPDDFMQETIESWTEDKWNRALKAAGII